jgi:quinohemoprotein ethanol dehydrogenase
MMNRATHRNFQKIVRQGALAANGMPNFGDLYSKKEIQAVHAYLVERANQDRALQQKARKKKKR